MTQTPAQRQQALAITTCVLTGLSGIGVLTRAILRFFVIRRPGWDDYTIVVAYLFTIGYLICIFIEIQNGQGLPMGSLTMDNMISQLKTTLAIELLYYGIVTMVKISICCMYMRFAVQERFRLATQITIGFLAVFFVTCIATTLSQCRPLYKMWDILKVVDGKCINSTVFFYFTSGFNIVTDFWILLLPIKTLMSVARPLREKIALLLIFSAGGFATIVSIIRLHTIYKYTLSEDPFRDGIPINIWSMVEINVGILCASVPAFKPLFTPSKLRSSMRSSSNRRGDTDKHVSEFRARARPSGSGSGSGGGSRYEDRPYETYHSRHIHEPMPMPPGGLPLAAVSHHNQPSEHGQHHHHHHHHHHHPHNREGSGHTMPRSPLPVSHSESTDLIIQKP